MCTGCHCFNWKSRRKEKDPGPSLPSAGDEYSKPFLEDDFVRERFIDADFIVLVELPSGVDYCEWLATNTKSFFEHLNLIYGCLSERCRPNVCNVTSGSGNIQYLWLDDRGKKCKCKAPQYIDRVMQFSQKCIYDEAIFPTKYGNAFPPFFKDTVQKINRLLLHVFAHIYDRHARDLVRIKLHGHLNTVYYHFHLFNHHFSLVDDSELNVLRDLFSRIHENVMRKIKFDPGIGDIVPSVAILDSDNRTERDIMRCNDDLIEAEQNSMTTLLSEEEKEDAAAAAGLDAKYVKLTLAT